MDLQAESSQQAEVGNERTEEQIGNRGANRPAGAGQQAGWSERQDGQKGRQGSMNRQDGW